MILHDSIFVGTTNDVEWVAECGKKRYFAITSDRNIQVNLNERNAMIQARIGVFAFSNGNWGSKAAMGAVTKAMPRILRIAGSQTKPFIAQISKNGQVRIWYDHEGSNLLSNAKRRKRRKG